MTPVAIAKTLRRFDAPTAIELRVTDQTAARSTPGDAKHCALATTLRDLGYTAFVMGTIALVAKPATRELLSHARARGVDTTGVVVGDLVLWRYRLAHKTRAGRIEFDRTGIFPPGDYVLKAPAYSDRLNREKYSSTRKERRDARLEGERPRYTRTLHLLRAAQVHEALRSDEVIA